MSKEEKKKLYKEFENDKEASFIYFKAHKIYLLCFIGVVYSIIATIFDIVKDVKYYAYLMDAFLFLFCYRFLRHLLGLDVFYMQVLDVNDNVLLLG